MNRKFTSTVAGASILLACIGILSRSIGFFREIIYANTFGLSKDFDIYLVGAVLPVILNSSIIYLSQNYFIPEYHKLTPENKSDREGLLVRSFWTFIFIGIFVAFILFILKGIIIENYLWNSDNQTKEISTGIFELFIFSIPFNAGYAVLVSYLQAEYKFFHPALSQLFLNLPIIILVLLLSNVWGIYTIGAGYLLGNVIQLIYLYLIIRKDTSLKTSIYLIPKGIKLGLNSTLLIVILIELVNQLYILVDRYFYNFIETGGISSLNYAYVIFVLPISVFSFALSTAIFPKLAEYFNRKNFIELERYFNLSLKILVLSFVPLALIFFTEGDFIIRIFFQHGKFNLRDTNVTYGVLKMYTISLVFYSAYALINKMVYSAGLIKQLLIISFFLLATKIVLNFLLVNSLKQDGLALSSALSYILICLSCIWLVYFKLHFKNKINILAYVFFYSCIALISYFISVKFINLFSFGWLLHSGIKIIVFSGIFILSIYLLYPKDSFIFKTLKK